MVKMRRNRIGESEKVKRKVAKGDFSFGGEGEI